MSPPAGPPAARPLTMLPPAAAWLCGGCSAPSSRSQSWESRPLCRLRPGFPSPGPSPAGLRAHGAGAQPLWETSPAPAGAAAQARTDALGADAARLPSTSSVVPKAAWVRGASGLTGLSCSARFCSWGCSSYSLCSASEPSRKVLETNPQRAGNLFLSKVADLQGQARWPCRNEELWPSVLRHGAVCCPSKCAPQMSTEPRRPRSQPPPAAGLPSSSSPTSPGVTPRAQFLPHCLIAP